MNSKGLCLLLISVLVVVESTPISYFDAGNANAFIDQILNAVKAKYNQTLDPFHIPDKVVSFRKKVGLITFHGEAKLTEGTITGLSHLIRSGDSTLGNENNHFVAHLQFGDKNIHVHYKGEATFMDLHTHVTLESQVGDIDVKATITLDSAGKATINQLEIDELEHVKIHVHTPIAILDPLIDLFGDEFVKIFNPMAKEMLSKLLKDMLGKELENFKMPVG